MRLIFCGVVVAFFAWLGWHSQKHSDHHRHNYSEAIYTVAEVEAVDKIIADSGVTYKSDSPHECAADWLCLIAWANEQHPKKGHHHE
jgi:hypothetical protein